MGKKLLIVLAGVVLLMIFAPPYVRENRFVDCRSGRLMSTIHVYGILISEEISDSSFSDYFCSIEDCNGQPDWQLCSSKSPFWQPASPQYRFGSVPYRLEDFIETLEERGLSNAEIKAECKEAGAILRNHDLSGLEAFLSRS